MSKKDYIFIGIATLALGVALSVAIFGGGETKTVTERIVEKAQRLAGTTNFDTISLGESLVIPGNVATDGFVYATTTIGGKQVVTMSGNWLSSSTPFYAYNPFGATSTARIVYFALTGEATSTSLDFVVGTSTRKFAPPSITLINTLGLTATTTGSDGVFGTTTIGKILTQVDGDVLLRDGRNGAATGTVAFSRGIGAWPEIQLLPNEFITSRALDCGRSLTDEARFTNALCSDGSIFNGDFDGEIIIEIWKND